MLELSQGVRLVAMVCNWGGWRFFAPGEERLFVTEWRNEVSQSSGNEMYCSLDSLNCEVELLKVWEGLIFCDCKKQGIKHGGGCK